MDWNYYGLPYTFIVWLVLLLPYFTFGEAYKVNRFSTIRSLPKQESDIITSPQLAYIKSIRPTIPLGGFFYFRKKYSSKEYGYFRGVLKSDAYQKLSAFEIKNSRYIERVKYKLFLDKKSDASDDIAEVYYDKKLVYVRGAKTLYFKRKGNWEKLKPLSSKPMIITIETVPPDAMVNVNGTFAGQSPIMVSGILTKGVKIFVSKRGYYSDEIYTSLKKGEHTYIKFSLIKIQLIDMEEVDSIVNNQPVISFHNSDVVNERIAYLEKLSAAIEMQDVQTLVQNFPKMTKRGKGESRKEYQRRETDFKFRKSQTIQNYKKLKRESLSKIKVDLEELQKHKYSSEIE